MTGCTVLASCNKAESSEAGYAPKPGNVISISVGTDSPEFSDAENPGTKITFDGEHLWWEGTEEMKVLVGDNSTTSLATGLQATIPSTGYGVFGGSIDLGDYDYSNVQAVVVPADAASYYYHSAKGEERVRIPLSYEQVQAKEGIMETSYAPVFARLQLEEAPEGDYSIDGLPMKAATYAVRFNVYGASAEGETLKSVALRFGTKRESYYEGRFNADGSISNIYQNGDATDTWTVSLTEEKTLAADKENGLKVFLSVSPKFSDIVAIEVKTDDATYTKAVTKSLGDTSADRNLLPGQMYQFGLNLSGFSRATDDAIKYSTDGKAWTNTLPDSFTDLYVKTEGEVTVSAADLDAIVTAMKAQSEAAGLDMGEATYESEVFPAVFKGTVPSTGNSAALTPTAPVTCIKSMVFPSNITEIAASAFAGATSLEAVNLTGIKKIGAQAFRNTGLKDLTVPSSVTYCGTYAFGYLLELQTCLFDAKLPDSGDGSGTYLFAHRTGNNQAALTRQLNAAAGKSGLTFTFGKNANTCMGYFFDGNCLLKKVIYANGASVFTNSNNYIRCWNLAEVVFQGTGRAYGPSNVINWNSDSGNQTTTAVVAGNWGTSINNVGQGVTDKKLTFDSTDAFNTFITTRVTSIRHLMILRRFVWRGYTMPLIYSTNYIDEAKSSCAWTTSIPETFTTLHVVGNPLTLNDLEAIKTAADAQTEKVTLNFGGTLYESTTFPDTFEGDAKITVAQLPVNCL